MPKAKPFSEADDHEKTNLESPWEEEASTTVEQGDVGDRIRQLGVEPRRPNTNLTNTGAGALDEPTVDDQHANPVLSAITPLRADHAARLVITQGNDVGQAFDVRPGKSYTIGRALDNDVVLTDIAVSRKHFDLRHEDGAWVIVDRGSGNGTVVNGNIEDNPFMLANGDVIEIGNTVFRYEQQNGAPRPQRTMDVAVDEEEMSTVAGKPLRNEVPPVDPEPAPARPQRPKTLPPPTPLRPVSPQPPPALSLPSPLPLSQPTPPPPLAIAQQPASTLPMPQMANRPPMSGPGAPTMLADGTPGIQPTTLPGQPPPQRAVFGYPQATEIPPHSVHAQMLLIQTQNRRNDGSTAHVPSLPYDGMLAQPARFSVQPQLSRRTKYFLGGAGLAVFAAIATIAIVKSNANTNPAASGTTQTMATVEMPTPDKPEPSVESIEPDATSPPAATNAGAPPATRGGEPGGAAPIAPTKSPAPTVATTTPSTPAPTTTTAPPTTTPPPTAVKAPATPSGAATPATPTKPPAPTVATTTPSTTPAPRATAPSTTTATARTTTPPPKPKATTKAKVARTEPKVTRREPRREPAPKRVAAVDVAAARERADSLYRQRKFNDASTVLSSASKTADDEDARDLRRTADIYAKLGRAFNAGTAAGTKPSEAFDKLISAATFDKNVGGAFESEIQSKLAVVAPKAAIHFLGNKDYRRARDAQLVAERAGNAGGVSLVKARLEAVARELYDEANRELASNPSVAKDKLRLIQEIVDKKNQTWQKATRALGG